MTRRSITAGGRTHLGSSSLFLAVATAVAALAVPLAALAHHSFAMFDANKSLSATATVKEFQWGSPHTWLELIVLDESKTEKPLSLELTTISGLLRNGWKPGTLKPGDRVTVTYHPMRDGTPAGQLVEAVTEDGRTLKGQ
jgi:Family of unknown function (DUF6152)